MYIGEAGYPFVNIPLVPRILKMDPNGNLSVFVDTNLNSPIVDIIFHDNLLTYRIEIKYQQLILQMVQ